MGTKLLTGANHFSITVGDIDRSVKFYSEVMEMDFEGIRYNVDWATSGKSPAIRTVF